MASHLQLAFRTQRGIGILNAAPTYEPLPGFQDVEGNCRCCAYSPCGRYFGQAEQSQVTIINTGTGETVSTLQTMNVYELQFAPRGNFIVTWERPSKDEAGDAAKNLKVWRVVEELPDGVQKKPLGAFVQKSQSGWNLQFTDDESLCARQVTNVVEFYRTSDFGTVWNKLHADGVASFAISPGESPSIAIFTPEKKGLPASIKLYSVPHFNSPVAQKTFFKADKVQLKWNSQGRTLLVLAQTDVDKSNKSYYGETTLYLLSTQGGFESRVTLSKEGPIHDVTWSPNGKEFGVVYGYMPAKTTIFNHRGVSQHDFGPGPRNTIIFSPTGRFALLAGFGNLTGQMDIYDLSKDYHKLCTIDTGNPSVCHWSPDSVYIMTATTSPRLRVDNGLKIWHARGGLVYKQDMNELYNVWWRPIPIGELPDIDPLRDTPTPHASAVEYLGTVKAPSKPVGAYRPPGARGASTPSLFKREDQGGVAHTPSFNGAFGGGANNPFNRPRRVHGAEPVEGAGDEQLSKAALKNKKKRLSKKKDHEQQQQDASAADKDNDTEKGKANHEDGNSNSNNNNNNNSLAPPPFDERPGGEGKSPDRRLRGNQSNNPRHRSHSRQGSSRNRGPDDQSRVRSSSMRPSSSRKPSAQGQGTAPARPQGPSRTPSHANGTTPPRGPKTAPGSEKKRSQQRQQQRQQQQNSADDGADDGDSQVNPLSRKIRSLTKKLRAIEELEMRRAGGEKLEETQVKKISTKEAVRTELGALLASV